MENLYLHLERLFSVNSKKVSLHAFDAFSVPYEVVFSEYQNKG